MTNHRFIQFFFLGFLINPMLWIAIYNFFNYKK
jgi:hypothetical protein